MRRPTPRPVHTTLRQFRSRSDFRMLVAVALCLLVAGCSTIRDPEPLVQKAVAAKADAVPTITTNVFNDAFRALDPSYQEGETLTISRDSALRLATQFSRELQTQREQLFLGGLSLLGTRRQFGIQYQGTLNYTFGVSGENANDSGRLELGAERILSPGSTLSVSGNTQSRIQETFGGRLEAAEDTVYRSALSGRLTQPLLAGAGYEASHEQYIQGERDLIYALRTFALARQDFVLTILDGYYRLLNQQKILANTRSNVEQSTFLRKRSEALFKVQMAASLDVLRSQQQELSALNQLSDAETNYDVALKRFLITAGLPVHLNLHVGGEFPQVEPITLDEQTCMEAALLLRMDFQTTGNQLEDAERRFRTASRGMLPQLDAFAAVSLNSEEDALAFEDQDLQESTTAGLSLVLPLDQRDERDARKQAQISVLAARRQLQQRADTIQVDIMENFRRLGSLQNTVTIQAKNMEITDRRARNSLIRFKRGELSNRDVVEAENELLGARNAYAQARVDYELQRLRLLRNIGLLDVAADGTLVELDFESVRAAAVREGIVK